MNIIHAEVPNLSIGTFPFVYIAGFFAPLAATLHILTIRALAMQPSLASSLVRLDGEAADPSRRSPGA